MMAENLILHNVLNLLTRRVEENLYQTIHRWHYFLTRKRIEEAWDKLSDCYQSSRRISLENFHYGAYALGEQDLKIIGEVTGLDVLDLGCGGGQNSEVLKKRGAKSVTGIDQSEKQIKHARRLANKTHVEIRFVKSDMENLSTIENEFFDLVVSSHAMNYALNLERVSVECNRILRDGGRLVICMNHPLWMMIGEALETGDWSKMVNYLRGS
jgi:ubiquinone/menaquinone biosynthesis C-methylase UbiE